MYPPHFPNFAIIQVAQAKELSTKGLTLYDIKLEFGRVEKPGEIMLIDELSGGNMRVFNGEESVYPLDLETYLF